MAIPLSCLLKGNLSIDRSYFAQKLFDSLRNQNAFDKPIAADLIFSKPIPTSSDGILLTDDLSSPQGKEEVVFYHPIQGVILAHSQYEWVCGKGYQEMFSTLKFIENLRLAENSDNVVAHFLHINSGGGEAWGLELAAAEMRACKKPIYAFIEGCCCSAAYYLASSAQVIKAFTANDIVGSIGVMVSFLDITGWLEQMGIKQIEEYATRSDLKNKMFRDLIEGKPEQYRSEMLDPHQAQFEAQVRSTRSALTDVDDEHPALRGEIFMATKAVENGLIDGILSDLGSAIGEAYELGKTIQTNNSLLKN